MVRQPWRLGERETRWFDVALAGVLLLPVLFLPLSGFPWVHTLLCLGQLAPLFWRRQRPVAVFAAVALVSGLQAAVIDSPLYSQIAFPVAVYSVARYARAAYGLGAMGVGFAGAAVATADWLAAFDEVSRSGYAWYFLTMSVIVVSAWALGTLARTRQAYVDALVERGERLEREAAQRAELAARDERSRIAREMHDVVAHGLSVIVVQADGARYAAAKDPQAAGNALETISATGREALGEMRNMLGLLRSEAVSDLRPQPGLDDLVFLFDDARAAGMDVETSLPQDPPDVPDGVALTAYRVVQEALTNVRKHAGPGARVELSVAVGDEVRIDVADDGRGAAAAVDGDGLGLVGMRERVTVHGGTLEAGPRPGGGYLVSARIPR